MSLVKILYLRDKNFQPIGCIAYSRSSDNSNIDHVQYELSVRNPRDAMDARGRSLGFNRARARQIATGRLDAHPISLLIPSTFTGEFASDAILVDIADRSPVCGISQVPDRARRAAANMLARGSRRARTLRAENAVEYLAEMSSSPL